MKQRTVTNPEEFFDAVSQIGDGPAFPSRFNNGQGQGEFVFPGMSRREYHASMMMAARLTKGYGDTPKKAAEDAVAFADALIAELDK